MTQTVTATGASRTQYAYQVHPIGTTYKAIAGNYMFGRFNAGSNTWDIFYIGQTMDLSTRFGNHHKLEAAKKLGATHILTRANSGGDAARKAEEQDLITSHKPRLNELLK